LGVSGVVVVVVELGGMVVGTPGPEQVPTSTQGGGRQAVEVQHRSGTPAGLWARVPAVVVVVVRSAGLEGAGTCRTAAAGGAGRDSGGAAVRVGAGVTAAGAVVEVVVVVGAGRTAAAELELGPPRG
jgi:hypothetical protein